MCYFHLYIYIFITLWWNEIVKIKRSVCCLHLYVLITSMVVGNIVHRLTILIHDISLPPFLPPSLHNAFSCPRLHRLFVFLYLCTVLCFDIQFFTFPLIFFWLNFCFVNSLKSSEPEFMISTPERLLELLSLKAIDLSGVSWLVMCSLDLFMQYQAHTYYILTSYFSY